MIRTVTALFDDTGEAEAAFDDISRRLPIMKGAIVTCGPGERPDFGAVYLSRGQREACEAELAGGGSLLIVQVEGDRIAEQAVALLDKHGEGGEKIEAAVAAPVASAEMAAAVPMSAASAMPQLGPLPTSASSVEGVPISTLSRRPVPPTPAPLPEPEVATEPDVVAEERVPLIEEELRVGKRAMVRGGARVHSFVEEVPVTRSIDLSEERTTVERRPVNRRLGDEEIAASGLLQDRVVEIAQMREEAVVTKQAYVREELVVRKSVQTRTERIDETVRRTAVEMERLQPEAAGPETPGSLTR